MADVAEKVQGAGGVLPFRLVEPVEREPGAPDSLDRAQRVGERVLAWKRATLRGMTEALPVPAGIEATT